MEPEILSSLLQMKRLYRIPLLVLAMAVGGHGQAEKALYPVTENAMFGFADADGNLEIKPQFDWASDFHNGLAIVQINGKKGFINRSGNIVVKPKYDDVADFSDGLALVCLNYRWGFIDQTGNEVIPLQFVEALSFSDGLAAVYIDNRNPKKDGQWGYINSKGDVVIPPKFFKAYEFHDGVAKVITGKFGDDNKQGFINKRGEFIIEAKYELVGEYSEGLIPVEVGSKDQKTSERKYRHISGKWGFVDSFGKLVIPAIFDFAYEFSEGLANVTIGDKYGYIDKTGNIVIAPQFEYSSNAYRCANFVEGRSCFERDGKIGFIDQTGKVIIEPQFTHVTNFSNGVARVNFGKGPNSVDGRFPIYDNYGLIDLSGRIIYKPTNKNDRPAFKSGPVDQAKYEGWRKIDEDLFSFYAPPEVQGGKRRGIDSAVYSYEGVDLTIIFDIGMMANPRPTGRELQQLVIDNQDVAIWHSQNTSQLNAELGSGLNKTHFNMIVSSKNLNLKEIAEKMFRSLRFK